MTAFLAKKDEIDFCPEPVGLSAFFIPVEAIRTHIRFMIDETGRRIAGQPVSGTTYFG